MKKATLFLIIATILFISCKKDVVGPTETPDDDNGQPYLEVNDTRFELYYDEYKEFNIVYKKYKNSQLKITSHDTRIAETSFYNLSDTIVSVKIEAKRVGKTHVEITAGNSSSSIEVEVLPRHPILPSLCCV